MLRALRFLLRKEFLQIGRDRVILRMLIVMPMIQLVILANAATFEVKRARLFVVDHDRTPASRGVVNALTASGRFRLEAASASMAHADEALLSRDVDAIVVLPTGFARDLTRDRHAQLQLVLDAENGSAAGVTRFYVAEILGRHAASLAAKDVSVISADGGAGTSSGGAAAIEIRSRGWYNPALDYRHYMVPGILVQLITIVGTLMTALNIVREKEAGTLDQLNVTPVPRSAFIAAKLIPMWCIGLLELAAGMLIARTLFDVPVVGSPLVVFVAASVYLVAALGIGLWISTIVHTQQQALFVTFSIMLIYVLMSGLFTPVSGMPDWVQWIAQVNPMLHFLSLMRAVLLKGAGLMDVSKELAILGVTAAVVLTASVRQYRKGG